MKRNGEGKARSVQEKTLKDAMYDLGNRLLSGTPFEDALARALGPLPYGDVLASRFRTELELCRGDCGQAIHTVFAPISGELAGSYSAILSA